MCAILDANVVAEVFGPSGRSEAGVGFFEWINTGKGRLVAGGDLFEELCKIQKFQDWWKTALLAGRARRMDDGEVGDRTKELKRQDLCQSNDEHVVALAQISEARLLYSNDQALQKDFKNTSLIADPPGRVYSTKQNKKFGKTHKSLLRRNVCR